ncbi:MAG: ABC transporter permease [Planctomycetota bacterium]|nr:MAG: ABC transporter permease [Planctomycetota bacterium]
MSRGARFGLAVLALLAAAALLAPLLPLPDPTEVRFERSLEPPSWVHDPVLGTDLKGRDILSRTLHGARVSLLAGLLGTAIALAVGIPYGALAGLRGGRLDRVMMRTADFFESLPLVVMVLFLLSVAQAYRDELAAAGLSRTHLFFTAVGLLFWLPTARVTRAETLRLRQAPFVQAARAQGAGTPWILRRHVLPHLWPSVLALLTLTVPRVILMEAFLSFLGLGVEPPAVSWGLLASEGIAALNPLVACWWLIAAPSFALALTLLALQLVGEGLRQPT